MFRINSYKYMYFVYKLFSLSVLQKFIYVCSMEIALIFLSDLHENHCGLVQSEHTDMANGTGEGKVYIKMACM